MVPVSLLYVSKIALPIHTTNASHSETDVEKTCWSSCQLIQQFCHRRYNVYSSFYSRLIIWFYSAILVDAWSWCLFLTWVLFSFVIDISMYFLFLLQVDSDDLFFIVHDGEKWALPTLFSRPLGFHQGVKHAGERSRSRTPKKETERMVSRNCRTVRFRQTHGINVVLFQQYRWTLDRDVYS